MQPTITSTQNARVKAWAALRQRRERDRTGLFLIEGEREVERAMSHVEMVEFILREDRGDLERDGAVVVADHVFKAISRREHADGIAAVARTPRLALEDLDAMDGPALVADGIEKPGNIGAMLRTADAFGAAFVGSSLATDLVNPGVIRSAQGSLFAGHVAAGDREEVVAWATARGAVAVAEPSASQSLWDTDLSGTVSVVVGSEHAGIDERWLEVGTPVAIPTSGTADSLNASVAAAVFLAESRRQRRT